MTLRVGIVAVLVLSKVPSVGLSTRPDDEA
jgi:hypothetical protein